jgi:predicted transcriptional regulator
MSVTLNFRTEESKRDEIDRIAKSLDRDRTWVLNEAVSNYLDLHRWQLEHIENGMRNQAEGRTYSTAEARARLAKYSARHKGKPAT